MKLQILSKHNQKYQISNNYQKKIVNLKQVQVRVFESFTQTYFVSATATILIRFTIKRIGDEIKGAS